MGRAVGEVMIPISCAFRGRGDRVQLPWRGRAGNPPRFLPENSSHPERSPDGRYNGRTMKRLRIALAALIVSAGIVSAQVSGPLKAGKRALEAGKLAEAAVRFFYSLRLIDSYEVDAIVAEPVSDVGLGSAIMDRLRRAAAGSGGNNS